MSAIPTTFVAWLQSLPLNWLYGQPVGIADAKSWGQIADDQTALLQQAVKARMPSLAPVDALGHIGGDRVLVEGSTETTANFRVRLNTAWDDWARAGSALELLVQLYWNGFSGAYIIQQNGLYYTLSGAPTAGVDPTGLLTIGHLSGLISALADSADPTRPAIPVGTPWWKFDDDTGHCSRFLVLFPGYFPYFVIYGQAVFTNSSVATVSWGSPTAYVGYHVQVGPATVTDGGGPVAVVADATTHTINGINIVASAPFTGFADVITYPDINGDGLSPADPFAQMSSGILARLKLIINTWRPAKALCVGVAAIQQGAIWGWPTTQTWGQVGLKWGDSLAPIVPID